MTTGVLSSGMEKRDKIILSVAVTLVTIAAIAVLAMVYEDQDAWRSALESFLERARGTPWALPVVCALFVVTGVVMFPLSILNLAVAMVFGLWGIFYALIGGMLNTAVYFWVGHYVRHHRGGKKLLAHPKIAPVDKKLKKAGVAGAVFMHTLPAPSFSAMNFIAGLSSVSFPVFFLGTFIALIPGAIARGVVGNSLTEVLLSPTRETWIYLAGGLVLWVVLIMGTQALVKRFIPASMIEN